METDNRPAIPAGIKRRVLVEAGHRCAIPTCRYIEVDLHHIIPWNKCKKHEYENLIALCSNCHRRADAGNIDRKSLVKYKHNLRFAHDKYSQIEMDFLFELYKKENKEDTKWPPFMHILIKRIIDSGFVELHTPSTTVMSNGMNLSAYKITITEKGIQFIDDLELHEIEET